MIKRTKKKKYSSIKYQFAMVCVIMITLTLLSCWCINNIFLDKYYLRNKQEKLIEAYNILYNGIQKDEVNSNILANSLQEISESENMSIWLLDDEMNLVLTTGNRDNMSMFQLQESVYNMYGTISKNTEVIKESDDYTIVKTNDRRFNSDYLQLTAVMGSGYFLVARSAMESFVQNAGISNRFLAYIGTIIIVLSSILAWIITDRMIKPIRKIVDISDRMASLDFEAKYTGDDRNELGVLGEHMNFLSETLENTISELKTANRDLEIEVEKKTKIDNMRKEFLSNVSHELKTPIALIQGYAEGLKECINDDPDSRDFYCDVIMDESSKMNNLVKKLLTLNKIEFGDVDINLQRFNISELLNNVAASVNILAEKNDIKVIRNYDPQIFVWGDEFEIEQVVTNYLSNAINHCLGEKKIEIKAYLKDNKTYVSVFNTGNPIPEEDIDKIWQKFYKVDKAHTREYGGSGIGLSIVKAIMENMGQEYGVKNFDNGVEFWFTLDSNNNESKEAKDGRNI